MGSALGAGVYAQAGETLGAACAWVARLRLVLLLPYITPAICKQRL